MAKRKLIYPGDCIADKKKTIEKCEHTWCNSPSEYSYTIREVPNSELNHHLDTPWDDGKVYWLRYCIYRQAIGEEDVVLNEEEPVEAPGIHKLRLMQTIKKPIKLCVVTDLWAKEREAELYNALQWIVWFLENKAYCKQPLFLKDNFIPPQGH